VKLTTAVVKSNGSLLLGLQVSHIPNAHIEHGTSFLAQLVELLI